MIEAEMELVYLCDTQIIDWNIVDVTYVHRTSLALRHAQPSETTSRSTKVGPVQNHIRAD